MNNSEFLNETVDYIQDVYKRLESYQRIEWELLVELDRICRKRNIRYWLCYGTLLGAIRDGGQVPWDYDIDVVTFFEDRHKLIDALSAELSDQYYYSYNDNTDSYVGGYRLLRLCKKGYSMEGLHLDVFFLVGACKNEKKMMRYHKKMERLKFIFEIKCRFGQTEENEKALKYIRKGYEWLYKLIPFSYLKRKEFILLNKYPVKDVVYVPFYGIVVPTDTFITAHITINGTVLPIPQGYDSLLRKLYGEYNSYPSIHARLKEFYNHTILVDKVQANYNQ